tara:strand:- start:110 stop:1387 length:1278 start_codon:yes stop_codon:yes gene_type:complete
MQIKFHLLILCLTFITQKIVYSQPILELEPPNYIKTVIFKGYKSNDQFPIVEIDEKFYLSFDDLRGSDENFYYKISFFNYDWTPSKLFKSDFLKGYDDQRITNFRSSFGTKQSYTNYKIEFPNEKTKFLKTGNYLLEIFDQKNDIVFSRKFLIYEKKTKINSIISSSNNLRNFNSHQNIKFSVSPVNLKFKNPKEDIKIVILQNYQWNSLVKDIKPIFIINDELQFNDNIKLEFEGGNEFYFFDTKDALAISNNITFVENNELYQTYLNTNIERNNYPYNNKQDINGDFKIRTLSGIDHDIESDYTRVHFSLAKNKINENEEIYIYGKFNNFSFSNENMMVFNPSLEIYEGNFLFKQGFYNYKYVSRFDGEVSVNKISGSHFNTENSFQILIYHKPIGEIFYALIGVDKISSFNISSSIEYQNGR